MKQILLKNFGSNFKCDSMDKRPFDLLSAALNQNVLVGLKGNVEFRGLLVAYDVHMNLVLEKAELLSNGETKKGFGKILLRGDSVIYISPSS